MCNIPKIKIKKKKTKLNLKMVFIYYLNHIYKFGPPQ